MPEPNTLLAVTISGLALSASPGPSMFYVISRSIGQSRAAGLASSLGLAIGGILLAIGSSLGLARVCEAHPRALIAVQVAGAMYLALLGWRILKEAMSGGEVSLLNVASDPMSRILSQGILVELLNPKTVLFLVAFVPQFVGNDGSINANELLVLSLLVPITAIPADLLASICGGTIAERLRGTPAAGLILSRISGLILLGLSARLLLLSL